MECFRPAQMYYHGLEMRSEFLQCRTVFPAPLNHRVKVFPLLLIALKFVCVELIQVVLVVTHYLETTVGVHGSVRNCQQVRIKYPRYEAVDVLDKTVPIRQICA